VKVKFMIPGKSLYSPGGLAALGLGATVLSCGASGAHVGGQWKERGMGYTRDLGEF
jgi:hypothetical protein